MNPLTSSQMKYLRGLAHGLKPVVLIGQNGLTDAVVQAAEAALNRHELIKVKFNEIKDKLQKKALSDRLENATSSCLVGMIGHTAIFYRRHKDAKQRKIIIPEKPS
jgi:RNA-binding protein